MSGTRYLLFRLRHLVFKLWFSDFETHFHRLKLHLEVQEVRNHLEIVFIAGPDHGRTVAGQAFLPVSLPLILRRLLICISILNLDFLKLHGKLLKRTRNIYE